MNNQNKKKRNKKRNRARNMEDSTLTILEAGGDVELPGRMHGKEEKPKKLPKKIRSVGEESYRPFHRK